MALATGMPVIGDLTMKFSSHSIHEQFQLPSFYQCFGQAKDLATLYLQPNVFFASPKSCQGMLFEFKGSEGCDGKAVIYNGDRGHRTKAGVSKSGDVPQSNTKPTEYADRADTTEDVSTTGFTASALEAIGDEGSSSEDDELTGYYFSRQTELHGEQATSRADTVSAPTRSRRQHGRKRSMEQDEGTSSTTIKRRCRPRLNFEKMQLNMKAEVVCISENNPSYFRPISPQDLTT